MAPTQKSIQHFTHPNHPLLQIANNNEYICDGCKIIGTGKRYSCKPCNFDLHEHCATCPATFSSFMHPQHPLTLVMRKPQGVCQINRTCDVCKDHVEGLFYRCKICEFDVHPLCTQLPQQVRHALHLAHPLTFQLPPSVDVGKCLVCKRQSGSWRYRCACCCVDIHLECIILAPPPSPGPPPCNQSSSTRSARPPPSYQPPPPYNGAYNNPYNTYQHQHPYHQYPNYNNFYPDYNNFNPGQGSGEDSGAGKVGKFMYSLVGKLAVGVLGNAVFGLTGL